MAAKVLAPSSGESFLDSPAFSHPRNKPPLSGFSPLDTSSPVSALRFDSSDLQEVHTVVPFNLTPQLNTPDSGFSGATSSTLLKTPESELSSSAVTPPSSAIGHRKRKTVTIDESQTSIVVISPDDLFNTYSRSEGQSHDLHEDDPVTLDLDADPSSDLLPLDLDDLGVLLDSVTGWPLKRSESLESRENPFLPGGELSREAEDLLSRATIIRDHFYLNENEKRALREQQEQESKQWSVKHAQIPENPYDHVHGNNFQRSPSSPTATIVIDEKISTPLSSSLLHAAAPSTPADAVDSGQPQLWENGKVGDSAASSDNVKLVIPEDESQRMPGSDGSHNWPRGDLQVHDSDKKPRNKCCSVM